MRSPGILRAGVAATACWLAGAALASAMVLWCESDPPIQVVTPAGTNLTVNNMIYVPRYDMHLATHFPVSAAAAAGGHGGRALPGLPPGSPGGFPCPPRPSGKHCPRSAPPGPC